jgi:hypothetical protein
MRRVRDVKKRTYDIWLIVGVVAFAVVVTEYHRIHDISILGTMIGTFCLLMGLFGFLRNRRS